MYIFKSITFLLVHYVLLTYFNFEGNKYLGYSYNYHESLSVKNHLLYNESLRIKEEEN